MADLAAGLGLGFAAAGLGTITAAVLPQRIPRWADFTPVADFVPLLTASLQPVSSFIVRTALALLVFAAVDRLTAGWTRRQALFSVLFVVVGLVIGGTAGGDLTEWIVHGLAMAVVLWVAYVFAAILGLNRAFARRDAGLVVMKSDPFLTNLHGDPRWPDFLLMMGLS